MMATVWADVYPQSHDGPKSCIRSTDKYFASTSMLQILHVGLVYRPATHLATLSISEANTGQYSFSRCGFGSVDGCIVIVACA